MKVVEFIEITGACDLTGVCFSAWDSARMMVTGKQSCGVWKTLSLLQFHLRTMECFSVETRTCSSTRTRRRTGKSISFTFGR